MPTIQAHIEGLRGLRDQVAQDVMQHCMNLSAMDASPGTLSGDRRIVQTLVEDALLHEVIITTAIESLEKGQICQAIEMLTPSLH